MKMTKNPFNPAFGLKPEQFIGRDDITEEFIRSISSPNNPWRSTLIIGVRGSGKTAMLSDIQSKLNESNTIIVGATPDGDFLERILGQIYRQMPESIINKLPKMKTISISAVVGVELGTEKDDPYFTRTFEYQITEMLELIKKEKSNVVFLIDESQKHSSEIRTFISTYQQLIVNGFPVSLVMAGLPEVITDVLNDDVLTFLRRANRVELENINITLVKAAYNNVFKRSNLKINEAIIDDAAHSTQGFPYLIQLIGYYLWENITKPFDGDAFDQTLIESKARLFKNVHQLVFDNLSNMERDFVFSMIQDIGESKIKDILNRLGKDKNYITQYRTRLITKGVVKASGHGKLVFTFPYMREFLEFKRNEIGLW